MNQAIDFLTLLNPEQLAAATHDKGPLLIVAGAGSGKTRVITSRIAYLMQQHQVPDHRILALTFTNKAANEMKERIHKALASEGTSLPFIGTFHAFCLRFLKTHKDLLETPFLAILDEDDREKIIQGILLRHNLNKKITAKNVSYQISQLKNKSLNPAHAAAESYSPLIPEIYRTYEQEKKLSKSLDFDDLLLETVKLLKSNHDVRHRYQQTLSHILVDEYQDTNVIQHELLKCLALNDKKTLTLDSLCAVGDEDQSIYSWRGATVENIMHFQEDFQGTTIIKIEQNYRSVQPILESANAVISHNKNRNPKSLWSTKPASDRLRIMACLSEYQEADMVTQFLKALKARGQSLQHSAILYRAHFQSRALEEALIKQAIPYKIIGGIQFYERKEIKDILGYLKLIVNPYDRASLFRVINCPLRGLGNKFEEYVTTLWQQMPFATFQELLTAGIQSGAISGTKKQAVEQFISVFKGLSADDKPSAVAEHIIQTTGYKTHLKDTYDVQEAQDRSDNIKELLEAMLHHEQQKTMTVSSFLDEVALLQAQVDADQKDQDRVILMTLHAAKGLEFQNVIITGLEEGLLPSSRSLNDENAIEEERRLLYVGITRAQERLILSYSRYRYSYGTMTDQRPSRFVPEIPESLAPRIDCSYQTTSNLYSYMSTWLGSPQAPTFSKIVTFGSAKAESITDKKVNSAWKKNQPVAHDSFGVGIIQDIELKSNQKTYLTIKFKSGTKKIAADFVKSV